MKPILLSVCALVLAVVMLPAASHAQIINRPSAITWNPQCALQAAGKFATCVNGGGGRWGCAFQAGLAYIDCSGGFAASQAARNGGPVSRLKTTLLGRRAIRSSR